MATFQVVSRGVVHHFSSEASYDINPNSGVLRVEERGQQNDKATYWSASAWDQVIDQLGFELDG